MKQVVCPACGQVLELGAEVRAGDVIACPFCAGVSLRLSEEHGKLMGKPIRKASCVCPDCEQQLELPDEATPGDILTCVCGVQHRLTYAYGAYALETL